MDTKPSVFISSTGDLRSARDLVAKVLLSMGYDPVWQDVEPTDGGDLLGVLRRWIDPCQLMIQLVGERYGAEPPAHLRPAGFDRASYTQYEALYFESLGRKVIYIFLDATFPTSTATPELAELQELQAAYRAKLKHDNRLRHSGIANDAGLELTIRRLQDDLAAFRRQSDARFRKILWITSGALAAVLLVALIVTIGIRAIHNRQAEQSAKIDQQTTKAADQSQQLERIEKLLAAQKQANPGAAPVLSAADQAILDEAKKQGSLKSRATASVLQPDADTDALLAQLRAQQSAQEFDLSMLEGKRWYFDKSSQYDKAIEPFEQAIALRPDSIEARTFAANAHQSASLGDIAAHQKRAIEIHEGTLKLVSSGSDDWAATQNNLANAWSDMPTGDKAENLRKAIDAYTAALTVYTKDAHPVDWAATQNNLAAAWQDLPTGDKAENLRKAIDGYTAALTVYTKDAHPVDWAQTQNNLAAAWWDMPTGDKAENLRKAIDGYTAALTVRTKDAHPVEWAATQNNLAVAWRNMPTGDKAENLRKAIDAYTAALTVRTKDAHPVDWAMTQNNLASAWADMPTGDKAENLRKAIDAYTAALTVRTKDAHPVDWAMTQNNLAVAWWNMPTGDKAENLRKAIDAYTAALTVYTKDADPVDWAMTQNNLANAWQTMPTGDKAENLHKAIDAFTAALTVRTKDAHPVDWAQTHYNLASAVADLAEQPGEDRCGLLRQAIAHDKAALTVRTPEAFPREHAGTMKNLQIDRRAYESAGCAQKVPFDDVPPAK